MENQRIRLTFNNGNVTFFHYHVDRDRQGNVYTTDYLYGTYTVSGNRATFSGDITSQFAYAELVDATYTSGDKTYNKVLRVHFSTRNDYATYYVIE